MEVVERLDLEGVVVGDDGSAAARAALAWAADYVRCTGVALHVVRVWTMQTATRPEDWSPGYMPSLAEFERACRDSVERRVQSQLAGYAGLEVQTHTLHGQPAEALVASTARAALLVVGWRGRGGLRDLFLGSTAEDVVRRARCAVVVVRPPAGAEVAPGGTATP